jgi:hypothetical protein
MLVGMDGTHRRGPISVGAWVRAVVAVHRGQGGMTLGRKALAGGDQGVVGVDESDLVHTHPHQT